MEKILDFGGKSKRAEFWWNVLIEFIIGAILAALSLDTVAYIYSLIVLIPSIALFIRRLRDSGHSPWNIFWIFLVIIGWIILLVFLIQDSK